MSHERAQQRARRHKADPYRAAKLAPKVWVPPTACGDCGDPELIHRDGRCLRVGCDCTNYHRPEETR